MKVYVYTQAPKEFYYLGVKHLKETGKIDSYEIINIKAFRKLAKNILISLGFLKHKQKDDISFKELFNRTLAPITLLFRKNIILGIEPYDWIVIYGLLLKALGKNLIYYTSWPFWHSGDQPKSEVLWSKYLWKIFLKDLKVVSINKRGAEELESFGAKVTQITHPVDIHRFSPSASKNVSEPLKVLTVVRLEERKGIGDLIKIAKEKVLGDTEIIICGQGPLKDRVAAESKKLKNLRYVPFDEDTLPDIYQSANVFVLNSYKVPGWEELFGMVVLEAMASGLPLVTTDCVGPKEIVKEGVFGFIVPQKNATVLSSKLKLLLADRALRERMATKAREEAVKHYNLNKIAKKWLSVLEA